MCSKWATLPVNRLPTTQTENMYSSLRAAASNHWLACFKVFSTLSGFYWTKKVLILPYSFEHTDCFFIYCVTKHCPPFTRFSKKKKKSQKEQPCLKGNKLTRTAWISCFDSSHADIRLPEFIPLQLGKWQQNCYVARFSNSFTDLDSCHEQLKD